jgi:SAM-dependent methyltransferase
VSVAESPAIGSTAWYDALRARSAPVLSDVRAAAYGPGGYVGQDSFMTADQIASLARAAGAKPGARVLDACCGSGGPGLHVARETGCRIVGVDRSREGLRQALTAARAGGLAGSVGFVAADATCLPLAAPLDAVLLLETMLAIEDKGRLLAEVGRLLRPGRRFGLTLEDGPPLSEGERRRTPAGDLVWLIGADEFVALGRAVGFRVERLDDHTPTHAAVAGRLAHGLRAHRDAVAAEVGEAVCAEMIAAHEHWAGWLSAGRVRKLAIVLERVG